MTSRQDRANEISESPAFLESLSLMVRLAFLHAKAAALHTRLSKELPKLVNADLKEYARLGNQINRARLAEAKLEESYPEAANLYDVPLQELESRYTPKMQAMKQEERQYQAEFDPDALGNNIRDMDPEQRRETQDTVERLSEAQEYKRSPAVQALIRDIWANLEANP